MPKVTAVMAARDAETTIEAAIDSVLAQSMADWELIIVNDGSTDGTAAQISKFSDPRIECISTANRGRAAARNSAIARAMGSLIAICDADDISFPDRFADQVKVLERLPDVSLVSSALSTFEDDAGSGGVTIRFPSSDESVHRSLRRGRMPIAHAACMFRRAWFLQAGGYNEDFMWCEDFELVLRAYRPGSFWNLQESALYYRQPASGVDWAYWKENETWRRRAVDGASSSRARASAGPILLAVDAVRFLVYRGRMTLARRGTDRL